MQCILLRATTFCQSKRSFPLSFPLGLPDGAACDSHVARFSQDSTIDDDVMSSFNSVVDVTSVLFQRQFPHSQLFKVDRASLPMYPTP